jgi:hypothetical protein
VNVVIILRVPYKFEGGGGLDQFSGNRLLENGLCSLGNLVITLNIKFYYKFMRKVSDLNYE